MSSAREQTPSWTFNLLKILTKFLSKIEYPQLKSGIVMPSFILLISTLIFACHLQKKIINKQLNIFRKLHCTL